MLYRIVERWIEIKQFAYMDIDSLNSHRCHNVDHVVPVAHAVHSLDIWWGFASALERKKVRHDCLNYITMLIFCWNDCFLYILWPGKKTELKMWTSLVEFNQWLNDFCKLYLRSYIRSQYWSFAELTFAWVVIVQNNGVTVLYAIMS